MKTIRESQWGNMGKRRMDERECVYIYISREIERTKFIARACEIKLPILIQSKVTIIVSPTIPAQFLFFSWFVIHEQNRLQKGKNEKERVTLWWDNLNSKRVFYYRVKSVDADVNRKLWYEVPGLKEVLFVP
jgi:hypothetical protein